MSRNDDEVRAQALDVVDAGRASPTPLFLGFLGALVFSAIVAFRSGFTLIGDGRLPGADRDRHRHGHDHVRRRDDLGRPRRAARIRARRGAPGRGRPAGPAGAGAGAGGARACAPRCWWCRSDSPSWPTTADSRCGAGSAEQPLRLGRAPWHAVAEVRATRVTRWGRAGGGITVTLTDDADGAPTELPFAVVGHGLGGLFAPSGRRLEALVDALDRGGSRLSPSSDPDVPTGTTRRPPPSAEMPSDRPSRSGRCGRASAPSRS